jgi:hypothetical protein
LNGGRRDASRLYDLPGIRIGEINPQSVKSSKNQLHQNHQPKSAILIQPLSHPQKYTKRRLCFRAIQAAGRIVWPLL